MPNPTEMELQLFQLLQCNSVSAAHAYWYQHQAKQQGKHHHSGTLRITDAQSDRNGVAAIPTVTM